MMIDLKQILVYNEAVSFRKLDNMNDDGLSLVNSWFKLLGFGYLELLPFNFL